MSNLVTPQQVWDAWSTHLIPYFQKCEKSLIDVVIKEIMERYASEQSISFRNQLTDYIRLQVCSIVYKLESIDTQNVDRSDVSNLDQSGLNITPQNLEARVRWQEYIKNSNYLVSDDGRVYSKYLNKYLSPHMNNGYYSIILRVNKFRHHERIHRLVATHFVSNSDPTTLNTVNHKDCNKTNNNYWNLEWVTPKGNSNYTTTREFYKPGNMKIVHQVNSDGEIINTFGSVREGSKYTGISESMISRNCYSSSSTRVNHYGIKYTWRFAITPTSQDIPADARPIKDFENYYVTKDGQIYSLWKGGYLTQSKKLDGYMEVCLSSLTIQKHYLVHRLVASAYLPSDETRPFVNHIDADRSNNCLNNLEYVTSHENLKHSYATGNNAKFKKSVKMIDPIKKVVLRTFESIAEASKATNINSMSISYCCNKQRRSGGGYLWQFEDELGIREIIPNSCLCPIEQLDLVSMTVVARHSSMTQAAESVDGVKQGISLVCKGKMSQYKGWFWRKASKVSILN